MPSVCQAAGLVMPCFLDAVLWAIASPSVCGVTDGAVFYCGVPSGTRRGSHRLDFRLRGNDGERRGLA